MPKDTTSICTAGNQSGNLLITSPTPSPLSHLTPSRWCIILLPECHHPLESLITFPQSWPLCTCFLTSIEYMLLFVFKALNGQAPFYISDLIQLHAPIKSLRSADKLFVYTRSCCIHIGDRTFAVSGPRLWNQLPLSIRLAPLLSVFKSKLKTHLYAPAFHTTS